jgi:hypothetical protein
VNEGHLCPGEINFEKRCYAVKKRFYIKLTAYIILIPFLIPLFTGCSRHAVTLSYDSIEHIAVYQADKYFNLNPAQKSALKKIIIEKRKEHRRSFLPGYLVITKKMKAALKKGVTQDDLNYFNSALKHEVSRAAVLLADDCASLLKTLSPEQINYFESSVKKYNTEQAKKISADDVKRKKYQLKKLMKTYKRIYGDFTPEQKSEIRSLYKNFPDTLGERIPYLEATQKQFTALLRNSSQQELSSFLKKWMTRDESLLSPAHLRKTLTAKKMSDELFLRVDRKIITAEQRRHAVDFAGEIEDIIKSLQKK